MVPHLSPSLHTVIRSQPFPFLEAEAMAEGNIIQGLADQALKSALAALSGPGTADQERQAAQAAVQHFRRRAHGRAQRYGRNDQENTLP